MFFKDKQDQNEKVASITDISIKKLKQVYSKYMFEAGLLTGKVSEKQVVKPYIEPELQSALNEKRDGKVFGRADRKLNVWKILIYECF